MRNWFGSHPKRLKLQELRRGRNYQYGFRPQVISPDSMIATFRPHFARVCDVVRFEKPPKTPGTGFNAKAHLHSEMTAQFMV
jgi:signal peptidase I